MIAVFHNGLCSTLLFIVPYLPALPRLDLSFSKTKHTMRNSSKLLLLGLALCTIPMGLQAQKMVLALHSKPQTSPHLRAEQSIRQANFPNFMAYCKAHLTYPAQARENGIEGLVLAKITVSASGQLSDLAIVQKLGFGCDEAVLKLLREMPSWVPAMQNGRAVAQKVYVPLVFHLCAGEKP
jgi:TonB family protein